MPSKGTKRFVSLLLSLLFVVSLLPASALADTPIVPAKGDLVFYQVYTAGGGNDGAYKKDYLILKNISASTLDVSECVVWYASKADAAIFNSVVTLPASMTALPPNAYVFIPTGSAGSGGLDLPTSFKPDVYTVSPGSIGLSSSAGKLAITAKNAAVPVNAGSDGILDYLAFGSGAETITPYMGTGSAAIGSGYTWADLPPNPCTSPRVS